MAVGSTKLSVTGSPVTTSGTITLDINEANLNIANMTGAISSARVTGLSTVATSGSYNDLTNKPVAYALPTASAITLGGIKIGAGLAIDGQGVVSVTATGGEGGTGSGTVTSVAVAAGSSKLTVTGSPITTSGTINVDVNEANLNIANMTGAIPSERVTGLATVATSGSYADLTNKPAIPAAYTLPTASATILGGVKVGANLSIDANGVLSATAAGGGSGTVTSVAVAAGSTKLTVTGSPITSSGTINVDVNEANLNIGNMGGTIAAAKVTSLATVATSGSYADLTNKPTIPAAYTDVQARAAISVSGSLAYNSTTGVISYTAPTLATVATSGNYNDLTNKPAAYSLPIASAAVLGGFKVGTGLSIDAQGVLNVTAGGGSGTVTSVAVTAGSSKVSVTGSPITSSGTIAVDVNEANLSITNMTGNIAAARVTGLATVATSGSYADLTNKPTIPAAYTDTQARAALSLNAGTSGATYNSTTGVLDLSALVTSGGTGGGTAPAASNIYGFTVTLDGGGATLNASQVTNLPAGWTVTTPGASVIVVTHNKGTPPMSMTVYGSAKINDGPYKVQVFSNGAGGFQLPATGSATLNTSSFQFTCSNTTASSVANGTVYVRVLF